MRCSISVTYLVLLLTVSVFSCFALDCRKFVFAPVCRGIIAKRAEITSRLRNPAYSPPEIEPLSEDSDRAYLEEQQKSTDETERQKQLNRMSFGTVQFPLFDYNSPSRTY